MNEQERLQAIQNRDKSYDGKFIFGVKTTKIICRPGCPAKIPLEKNVVFFDTMEEAAERATGLVKDVNRNSVSQNRRSRKCAASSYCSK